ncbi:hypothetical protein A5715_03135 [Mycolicibacter heraklionensis]|nr:hypothetical protein A5715_03135 [Mycolicibacter heraklionensis]
MRCRANDQDPGGRTSLPDLQRQCQRSHAITDDGNIVIGLLVIARRQAGTDAPGKSLSRLFTQAGGLHAGVHVSPTRTPGRGLADGGKDHSLR